MTDKPAPGQPPVDKEATPGGVNVPFVERRAIPTQAFPGNSKSTSKHPHFAITPGKLREALFYRWKSALAVGLIFAAIGVGIAWLTYKPRYTASALMRMSSSKQRLIPGAQADDAGVTREDGFQKTQAQLLKAHDILDSVLKKDQIRGLTLVRNQENPLLWLEKELQGNFATGTDIFRISLSGEDPAEVALIVNTVKDVFRDQFLKASEQQQADRFNNVDRVMVETEEKIRKKRNELRNLAEFHKTGDTQVLTLKQKMVIEEYGAMKREQQGLDSEIRKTKSTLAMQRDELTASKDEKIPPEVIEEYLDRDVDVQKGKSEIASLEIQIKEYRKVATDVNLGLAKLETEMKAAQARLQKVRLDAQPEVTQKARNYRKVQRLNNIAQSEGKLNVLLGQVAVVGEQAKELAKEAEVIGLGSIDIEFRRNEIEAADAVLRNLRGERERLEIEKANKKENFVVIQHADVPTLNQASLLKTGSMFAAAGLLLGLLGVSYLEARLHRVHQSNQVAQELGIQTLGVLPILAQNVARSYGQPPGGEEPQPDVMFADAVDSLCARLLCDDRLGKSSVIMVTSASSGEGKTMLATQLAAGLARSGRRTMVIDCDFRNPHCHEQFDLEPGPGLSEVLCGEAKLADVLHHVPESEVRVLTAGTSNPRVIKALNNGKLAALFAHLRSQFDCIIVDSAPTPVVSDGLLISKLADGVILVVRPKVSKAPAVLAAYEQLAVLKIRTLGAVINADSERTSGSYYK